MHGPAAREPTPEATVVVEPLVCMSLPHSKHRWVMTATLVHSPIISSLDSVGSTAVTSTTLSSYWLVCGDRKGSLHVYQTNLKPPSSQAKKVLHMCRYNPMFSISSHSTYSRYSHCVVFMVPME